MPSFPCSPKFVNGSFWNNLFSKVKKDTQNILSKPAVVNDWQNMTDGYAAGSPINYSGMDNSDSGWANNVADNLRNTQLNSRLASQNYLQDGYETEAYGSLGKNAFYSQKS